jgi:hypothetical protein
MSSGPGVTIGDAIKEGTLRAMLESYDADVIGENVESEPARLSQLIDFAAGMNAALLIVQERIKRGEPIAAMVPRLLNEAGEIYVSLNPEHYRKRT